MSVSIMSAVFKQSKATYGDRLVLLAIADCAGDEDGRAWPSVKTIAKKTALCERMVHYSIAKLVEAGELMVERGKGPRGCNLFTVLVGSPELGRVQPIAPVKPIAVGGATHFTKVVQPIAPKSSLNHQRTTSTPLTPQRGNAFAVKFEKQFCEFWNQLPKANRIGLGKTKEAWNKQVSNGSTPEDILEGVEKLVKYEKLRKDQDPNGYRALHPTTWLNQERWNDGERMEAEES